MKISFLGRFKAFITGTTYTTEQGPVEIDPDTNLPVPPEGFVWKIASTVRKEGFFIWLADTSQRSEDYSDVPEHRSKLIFYTRGGIKPPHLVTPADFQKAAERILREYEKDTRTEKVDAEAIAKYSGTYPPKKLGVGLDTNPETD